MYIAELVLKMFNTKRPIRIKTDVLGLVIEVCFIQKYKN